MNLIRQLINFLDPKEETPQEKTISIDAYVVKPDEYNLQSPLIVVGFPGGNHVAREESNDEASIRNYLDYRFIKRWIKTNQTDTHDLSEDQRDLKGNGKLDRAFHYGGQYHFYEAKGSEEVQGVIAELKDNFGLVPMSQLPDYLASDLGRLV